MRTKLILALALVISISCASLPPAQEVQRIPDVVQTFDGNVSQAVDAALDYLELAVTKEEQAAGAYLLVAPLVPPTFDAQVRKGFVAVSDLIIAAVDGIKRGVRTWADFRALLQPIVTAMNALNDWIRQVQPQPGSSWKALAGELTTLVAKAAIQKVLR